MAECLVCTNFGRTLDCCKAARGPCALCEEFHHLLTREVTQQVSAHLARQNEENDEAWRARCDDLEAQIKVLQETPEKRAQEKSDMIESLKRQTEDADAEEKRLWKYAAERRQVLKKLQEQLRVRETPQEFVFREAKKGKKGKKR
ncbi:hypothetical protein TW65_05418 [Stemphylium lycopersici]|uniref:Uncharacterized protein n=1 Tax=Stemphylium lycopersici TaxID=183478 RepID=A0A364N7C2_STELY|nr:hypothetical protein TW65_05418 [Stemphylium lycopersici]RAR12931.1 hypothetical protein DDE83_003729 [Stemphylium lycopersici]